MAKAITSSFVTKIPLKTGSHERSILEKRFFAAKQQYNALIGEALKRLSSMRDDVRYKEARELYKQEGEKTKPKNCSKCLQKNMDIGNTTYTPTVSNGTKKGTSYP
jgi:hypothetical protein